MKIIDTKISRHEDPNLVKVEFVGAEDAVMISMRGAGVVELTDAEAVDHARQVMSGALAEIELDTSAAEQTIDPALASEQALEEPANDWPAADRS